MNQTPYVCFSNLSILFFFFLTLFCPLLPEHALHKRLRQQTCFEILLELLLLPQREGGTAAGEGEAAIGCAAGARSAPFQLSHLRKETGACCLCKRQ